MISHHFYSSWSLFFMLIIVPSMALNLDGTLLLSLKYSILNDPSSILDNWDYNDATPCLWSGVTCAQVETSLGTPDMFRVVSLVLPSSNLAGSIPEDIGYVEHLRILDLSNNLFNGILPSSIFNGSEIQVVSLSNNGFSGELSEIIGEVKNLKVLNVSGNALTGKIPEKIASLQNLSVVSLRGNKFSGKIPSGFDFVEVLDMSSNSLTGSLPDEFGGARLRYLNLSSNKLSGLVSEEFVKKIPTNATIDLSFNNLAGEIPESIALSNQKTESFAGNVELCGKPLKKLCSIPSTKSTPPHGVATNTSSPAIAAIPKTFEANPSQGSYQTTGNAAQNQSKHGLNPGTIAGIAVGDLAGIGILALICLYVYQLRKKKKLAENTAEIKNPTDQEQKYQIKPEPSSVIVIKDSKNVSNWSCLSIKNGEETSEETGSETDQENTKNQEIEYEKQQQRQQHHEKSLVMVDDEIQLEVETLFKASAYILGSSGVSIVYKAVLQDGSSFAVRRIGESGVERLKDFENQVKAIAKLRHPNLVRVRGFYWGDDEKLVIYEYISNGSLENAGYRKIGSSPYHLPYEIRLKIATGVARGLAYIHEKKHVHGNIKPSNILLTQDMEPIISDFGLQWLVYGNKQTRKSDGSARHFGSKRSTSSSNDGLQYDHHHHSYNGSPYIAPTGFVGCTSPYHAPESLQNLKPNPKWDVYSFGVLLLELLTGKVFSERELNQWTADSIEEDKNRILKMADMTIRGEVANREDATLACFKLGFSCASLIPQKRPSMKDALQVLEKIPCSSTYY